MLSPNLIIIWPGTHASIPTNYTRETTLDGLYPKGAAAASNPNTTGGTATHTHTSPSHTHTVQAHTHTGTTGSTAQEAGISNTDSSGSSLPTGVHFHSYSISTIASTSVSSASVTYGAVSNDPPYYEVIFIKSNGYSGIPANAVMLSRLQTYSGFSVCDGSGGTPNLNNRYLKGAATSSNAGTTGGSTTNTHTISHTHTAQHSHSGSTGVPSSGSTPGNLGGNNTDSSGRDHTHNITLISTTPNTDSNSSIGSQAETVEPAHTKIYPLQNTSGVSKLAQKGMMAMYLGTLATIPPGWKLCDGTSSTIDMRSRHLKLTSTFGDVGTTGGSNTHTHAAQSHNHTVQAHTHSGSETGVNPAGVGANQRGTGGGVAHRYWTNIAGQHSVNTSSSTTGTTSSDSTTADSSNNEPSYRTVLFLEFDFMIGGAGLLTLL